MAQRTVRGFVCILCISFLFLSFGCKKNPPVSQIPLDQIQVTPVITPTVYRYGPCSGALEATIIQNINNVKKNTTITTNYSIIQDGQHLIWHMHIPKLIENGRPVIPHVPIVDMTMDTDIRGIEGSSQVTFPLLLSMGNKAPSDFKKAMKSLRKNLTNLSPPLPEEGIVTGQPLRKAPLNDPPPTLIVQQKEIELILDGEISDNNIVYVSASLNEEITLTDKASGVQIFMVLKGRSIFQKDTMELVTGVLDANIYDGMGKSHGYLSVMMERVDN